MGLYDSFFYDTNINPIFNDSATSDLGWFEGKILKRFMPSYNSVAVNEQILASEPTDSDHVFHFSLSTPKSRIRKSILTQNSNFNRTSTANADPLKIVTVIPHFSEIFTSLTAPFKILTLLLAGIIIYIFIRILNFVVDRIFWLKLENKASYKAILSKIENMKNHILLYSINGISTIDTKADKITFPQSKKKSELNKWIKHTYSKINSYTDILIIENLEVNADSKKANDFKLMLLEYLVFSTDKWIVAVSSMDPMSCFNLGDKSENWQILLSRFERKWEDCKSLSNNTGENEDEYNVTTDFTEFIINECFEINCGPIKNNISSIGKEIINTNINYSLKRDIVINQVLEKAVCVFC